MSAIAELCSKSLSNFVRNCQIVFQVTVQFYNDWEFLLSTSLTKVSIVGLLDFTHSNRCAVVPHSFNLQFSKDKWYLISFHIYLPPIFFGEMTHGLVCQFPWLVYCLIVEFPKFFWIFWMWVLYWISCNYFFSIYGLSFNLLRTFQGEVLNFYFIIFVFFMYHSFADVFYHLTQCYIDFLLYFLLDVSDLVLLPICIWFLWGSKVCV